MDILVNVANQKLKIATNLKSLVAGTQEFVRFVFNTSGDWDDLLTFAQFTQNGVSYNQYLDNDNSAYLPSEIGVGTCTLMLYGSNENTIATTNYLTLTIDENILVADAQSTEISQSLYTQLVTRVNTLLTWNEQNASDLIATDTDLQRQINTKANASDLSSEITRAQQAEVANANAIATKASQSQVDELSIKVTQLENNEVVAGLISDAVESELTTYLNNGTLANLTITDGSITRDKVNSAFETTLAKADSAMQPSVYDPQNLHVDVFSYAQGRADIVQNNLNSTKSEIQDAYRLSDTVVHQNLGDAVRGAITLSRNYTQALLADYKAFTVTIVNELPLIGEAMTFYLVPNSSGDGYDKYWWIYDATTNTSKWDCFGSATTVVITQLPESGDEEVDYILKSNGGCLYYKWIDSDWWIVGGSKAEVLSSLPVTGNEYTDYYLLNASGTYVHYRWINNAFRPIGSNAYTKDEVDSLLAAINDSLSDMSSDINSLSGDIDVIDAKVDALGNLVSDVTEISTGIQVHFKDGTSKNVDTKDNSVKVEDVNRSENGLTIVYTDGDTKDIEISGGGGGTSSGSASITRVTASSTQCVYGDNCNITYSFSAIDSAGDMVGDGTATWYVNNVRKATSTAHQGNNTFNIGSYLNVGSNNVKLSISVDTGGDTPTVTTKTWSVNAINMYIVWDYDDTTINEAETFAIRWTPYGELSKTTHIVIDGVEYTTSVTTRSGVQQYISINKLSHGSHMVRLYCTATVNSQTITSESIYHDMIFVDSSSNVPVISCSVSTNTMVQYNTLPIPIVVYTPGSLTSNISLKVDGTEVASWSDIDRTLHYWNYTPSTYGNKVLTIKSGTTTKTINLTVTQLSIDNEEISGYAFRLKASDIAGNDALRAWSSNGITATFSQNFDWNNGGIKTEAANDGTIRQYICVKAGTSMTINYELFANDAKVNGKNFKVIFKTANCRDYDAVWLDCLSNNIGVSLGANGGTASSEQNTVDVQYAEGSYTEFEYDVYPDSLSSSAGNPMRYIQTYLDGVLSSTTIYASNDNFTQTNRKKIIIGSADCDVFIYMVKVYETYITRENHIVNFIADAPNAVEMVERYNRNDILAENGEISYLKLSQQNPNCRVHLWDIPRMTQNKIKKDPVAGCSYQQIYGAGDEGDQITAENVTIGIQGTSSINYVSSAANTDGRFNDGFTDGNGNHLNGYSMTDNSVPVNYFNTKVNVASCENINNMCLAQWYDSHQPYRTGARANITNGRDCMEHHIGVQFIRDRHEDNEPASAALFTDIDPDGSNYHMYAICNMGNSKDNGTVFHDANNPLECCVETKDNNSAICMMTSQLTLADLDSEDYFEFRYPKSPTASMKTAFINFVNWMYSRNPAAATGDALTSSVTYGAYTFKGTSSWDNNEQNEVLAGLTISDYAGTYTHDTYEYRMARLLYECEDHLVMDSIVYHYVFVEQHAMVDNVCKNTFWGTDDLVHWHLCKNYDNDTADGNNNTGKLTIPFGAEGMDTISGGDVFNGKMNVYWQFVYGLYPARRLMWQNREAAGTWNADAYLAFATGWQNYLPERVYNQDYWYKYLRPYEQNADTQYITMLEGGKKSHQREAFVKNNLTYMASQYTGTYCTSDSITVRAYTPGVSADMSEEEADIIETTIEAVPPNPVVRVMLYNKGYIVVEVASVMKRIKAEKGVYYTVDFSESSSSMNDTVINIHGAGNVRAIGDMSSLYIKYCNFSKASKLRSLQIGSNVQGYTNLGLESVGFESNPMLEELYIQNCPNSNTTLDLSGCQSLKTLDIRGSGFTGINFAVGGLLEEAHLNSPTSLSMRSLYYISDETLTLEGYGNLTTLRFEDVQNVNSLAIVNSSPSLSRVRILGIDWELSATTILNRLLTLMGLDENDHNTDTSILTGQVYVSGAIRNQELLNYANAWSNLEVTYNSGNLVEQYLATYVNSDGTTLCTVYVDRGSTPPNPVSLGLISTPIMESTAQYTFSFSGWNDIESVMLSARTITAQYTPTIRTYTVNWYSRVGLLLETTTTTYGSEVNYSGSTPTNTSRESEYVYSVFNGWDKSTGYITGDTDVYAVWDTASLPSTSKELEDMTCGEVFAVCMSGQAASHFTDKDHIDIQLGSDFTFSNVDSQVVLQDRFFDGEDDYYDTNIKLFDTDSPSFTIAIDYEFLASNVSGNTLVACYEESGNEGFRLRYNGSNSNVVWGDRNMNVGYGSNRNIVVLRHVQGSRSLFVYSFNNSDTTYDLTLGTGEMVRTRETVSEQVLSFGAIRFIDDNGHDYYGSGWIHWCKIWYADLGDVVARKLASFPHEILRMEFCGANRYRLSGQTSVRANGSFIACNPLSLLRRMNSTNTNVGGWDGCEMRTFLSTRIYNALPINWQSAIKQVKISASAGNQSSEIVVSDDKIYLASNREVGGNTSEPYASEGSAISFFTSNARRIKIPGWIISDDAQFISSASDPTAMVSYTVREGDIWINTSTDSIGYVYISADTMAKHSKLGFRAFTSSDNIQASDGGVWVRAHYWWERSPLASYSTSFMGVNTGGNPYINNGASLAFGVVVCFSI